MSLPAIYIDLKKTDYGGFVRDGDKHLHDKLALPANYSYQWSGEYELELRPKQRLQLILPIVFFVIFLLLYLVFHSFAEALVLIFPTIYAMTGGLLLQWLLHYNFSVAVAVGYIALFGIAVETGVVMVVYLHEALEHKLKSGNASTNADIEARSDRRCGPASAVGLSAIIQAVVSKEEMSRSLPDDSARSVAVARGLGAASSSCSYAAVALARSMFRKGETSDSDADLSSPIG